MSYQYYGVGDEEGSSSANFEFNGTSNLDLKGKRVVNIANPLDEGDAYNKICYERARKHEEGSTWITRKGCFPVKRKRKHWDE